MNIYIKDLKKFARKIWVEKNMGRDQLKTWLFGTKRFIDVYIFTLLKFIH